MNPADKPFAHGPIEAAWSKHVKPIAQTSSCEAAHSGYVLSGRMHVVMDDGDEVEIGPG